MQITKTLMYMLAVMIITVSVSWAATSNALTKATIPLTDNITSSTSTQACTMDARMCPDGSFVGRTGPKCEFAACPTLKTPLTPPEEVEEVMTVDNPPMPSKCTMDARICSDGSFVGRSGPKCEFAACPALKTPLTPPAELGQAPKATGGTFSRNLKIGDTGEDVRQLQKFLNNQGFSVAKVGVGSIGMETTTFGEGTKQALQAYQNAHAAELVTPTGEQTATGIFGPLTRAKVNPAVSETLTKSNPTLPTTATITEKISYLLEQVKVLQAKLNAQ